MQGLAREVPPPTPQPCGPQSSLCQSLVTGHPSSCQPSPPAHPHHILPSGYSGCATLAHSLPSLGWGLLCQKEEGLHWGVVDDVLPPAPTSYPTYSELWMGLNQASPELRSYKAR